MSGQTGTRPWPLYVVFVVMFVTAMVGLVGPRLWGDQTAISDNTLWGMLVISIVVAAALAFVPQVSDWFHRQTLGGKLDAVNASLDAGGKTGLLLNEIKSALDPAADGWKRIEAIETKLADLDDLRAVVDRIAAAPAPIDAKKFDDLAADVKTQDAKIEALGRQLEALAEIQKRLDAIQAAMKPARAPRDPQ